MTTLVKTYGIRMPPSDYGAVESFDHNKRDDLTQSTNDQKQNQNHTTDSIAVSKHAREATKKPSPQQLSQIVHEHARQLPEAYGTATLHRFMEAKTFSRFESYN